MTMFLFQYCYPYLAKRYPVKVPVRYHIRLKLYPNVTVSSKLLLQPLPSVTTLSTRKFRQLKPGKNSQNSRDFGWPRVTRSASRKLRLGKLFSKQY